MCKLALAKTSDGRAYQTVINMIKHQEEVTAGHSTGIAWFDTTKGNIHIRKAVGKINSFLAEYPDIPKSNLAIGHTRFATVGAVNKANQHPISIQFHGKTIGFGVHNGHWSGYYKYEHYRKKRQENKTDSAVMFAVYEKILEQLGNASHESRVRAMATLQRFVGYGAGSSQNIIIMFKDRHIVFSGHTLTYKEKKDFFGIMTFGYSDHKVDSDKIYEVKQFHVVTYPFNPIEFSLEPKEKKHKETEKSCSYIPKKITEYMDDDDDIDEEPVRYKKDTQVETRRIDGQTFYYIGTYSSEELARKAAEITKANYKRNNYDFYYRILEQEIDEMQGKRKAWKLFGRKETGIYSYDDVKKWWNW